MNKSLLCTVSLILFSAISIVLCNLDARATVADHLMPTFNPVVPFSVTRVGDAPQSAPVLAPPPTSIAVPNLALPCPEKIIKQVKQRKRKSHNTPAIFPARPFSQNMLQQYAALLLLSNKIKGVHQYNGLGGGRKDKTNRPLILQKNKKSVPQSECTPTIKRLSLKQHKAQTCQPKAAVGS